jgi:hypothetical protein
VQYVALELGAGNDRARGRRNRTRPRHSTIVLIKLGEPWELRALAESLQAHGISSQIDSHPLGEAMAASRGARGQPARLGIYVARADLDAVREFAAEFAANEASAGDAELSHDPGACPACGEPTPEHASA